MKKLLSIFLLLFIFNCATQQKKPRKILDEYMVHLKRMPKPMQVVKLAYPDALVLELSDDLFYMWVIKNDMTYLYAVHKINLTVEKVYKIELTSGYIPNIKYNRRYSKIKPIK
jgi:hypothetical protein